MANLLMIHLQGTDMFSYLPLIAVLTPMIGSVLIILNSIRNKFSTPLIAVLFSVFTFYFTAELFWLAWQGYSVFYRLPAMAGSALLMKVDLTGALFALFTAIIWLVAVLASLPYINEHKNRYYLFLIFTLSGCLGVFLCGDFLSLFLFFELMTFAAYALVVHNQTGEALQAGGSYLYLSIIGGLLLLAGIMVLNSLTGTVDITAQAHLLAENKRGAFLVAFLFVAGFGVKAGMMPLHIWLPKAHPVAPAPASALLSGVMIKTGAYGIIRVVTMLSAPPAGLAKDSLWRLSEGLGHTVIWVGIITMFFAALVAILQNNAKRLLAYSSVSQMGYILAGIGAAGYLGSGGALAFGAFSYHILNHAFFKSGLFILFGFIYTRLHQVEMDRLGGLWRKFPFTFAAFLACAFGITGVPGFNGYVSKTLLHHAMTEAYLHQGLFDLWVAEKIFVFTSGLTVCYIIRLVISVFGGPLKGVNQSILDGPQAKESWLERLVALFFIAAVALLGLGPEFIVTKIMVPMTAAFTYGEAYIYELAQTYVWTFSDILGIVVAFVIGGALYLLAEKKELFSFKPPVYLSVERLVYRPATLILEMAFTKAGLFIDSNLNQGFHSAPYLLTKVAEGAYSIDAQLFKKVGPHFIDMSTTLFNKVYQSWLELLRALMNKLGIFFRKAFMALFKFDYSARGDQRFETFNIANIDFGLYIVLIVIGIILAASLLMFL